MYKYLIKYALYQFAFLTLASKNKFYIFVSLGFFRFLPPTSNWPATKIF